MIFPNPQKTRHRVCVLQKPNHISPFYMERKWYTHTHSNSLYMPGRFPDGGGFPYLPKGIVFPPYNPPYFFFLPCLLFPQFL